MRRLSIAGVLTVACLAVGAPEGAGAQSGPSFDCSRAFQNVERAICASPGLSGLDRDMLELYHARLQNLTDERQRTSFIHGNTAWKEHRNSDCDEGTHADLACIRDKYVQRMAALRRVDVAQATNLFETVGDAVWLQIASEDVRQNAINRAYIHGQLLDHLTDTKVFLSSNGWYAIALGPMSRERARRIGDSLGREVPDLEGDHFTNHGKGYLNLVYSARKRTLYPYQSPVPAPAAPTAPAMVDTSLAPPPSPPATVAEAPAPPVSEPPRPVLPASTFTRPVIRRDGSRGATCSPASLRERQGMCYVLAIGEHACAEGLERQTGYNSGHILGEATIGATCTAIVAKLSSGQLTEDMLVTSALIGGVDAVGENMMASDNGLLWFLGAAVRVSVVAKKAQLAAQCARMEAQQCGYR